MSELFKNCGPVDCAGLQKLLQPIIDKMEEDSNFTQFGFKGRTLPDGTVDYGEGKGLEFFKHFTTYTNWQPGFEDKQILNFTRGVPEGKIGRVRLMKIVPHHCYSWHKDFTPRFHIPLITNDSSFLVVDNQVKHLSQGFLWLVDTRKPHTAFNGGHANRYHVVYEFAGTLDEMPAWNN